MAENQQNLILTEQDQALLALRKEIDQVDNQLISLFEQRMGIITKVGELKQSNKEKFLIRSSREADMIKDLVSKVGANFPKSTIVDIWRKLITAANMKEQSLTIAIHNPKNISDYNYLVKSYYNDAVPLHVFDSATSIVSAMEKGQAQIGIFALPANDHEEQNKKEDNNENWWIGLANNRLGLKVFAKIPFIEFSDEEKNRNQIQLVAVALKEPEKSREDNSLLYLEVSKEFSKMQILSSLKEQGLSAKILKSVKLPQVDGMVFYLVDLQGFYLEADDVIKNFSKSKIKPYVKVLGHYAVPIKV